MNVDVLGLLLDVTELGSCYHKHSLGQVSCDALVVNVVADTEALLKFGYTRSSVPMNLAFSDDMKNVSIVLQLKVKVFQVNSGDVQSDLLLTRDEQNSRVRKHIYRQVCRMTGYSRSRLQFH